MNRPFSFTARMAFPLALALFVVTIIVNALAQVLVWAVTRGAPAQAR